MIDIQMPGMSGLSFELISKIQSEQMPSVVFATAFDSFAVDAFNVHALDYLLNPLTLVGLNNRWTVSAVISLEHVKTQEHRPKKGV